MTENLTFEAGRFHRTRDGRKARIYAVDGVPRWPLHGALLYPHGWVPGHWSENGGYAYIESGYDLIAPWIDKPEVDWSKMPAWANAVAFSAMLQHWKWFEITPEPGDMIWDYTGRTGVIPPEFAPNWTGEWRDSLVTRPGGAL